VRKAQKLLDIPVPLHGIGEKYGIELRIQRHDSD